MSRTSFVLIFIIINSRCHSTLPNDGASSSPLNSGCLLCTVPFAALSPVCVVRRSLFMPVPPRPPPNQQLFVFCYCFCSFVHSFLFLSFAVSPTLYSAFIYVWLSHSMCCCCASTSDRNFSSSHSSFSWISFCALVYLLI